MEFMSLPAHQKSNSSLHMHVNATVIIGTWDAHLCGCLNGSSICLSESDPSISQSIALYFLFVVFMVPFDYNDHLYTRPIFFIIRFCSSEPRGHSSV